MGAQDLCWGWWSCLQPWLIKVMLLALVGKAVALGFRVLRFSPCCQWPSWGAVLQVLMHTPKKRQSKALSGGNRGNPWIRNIFNYLGWNAPLLQDGEIPLKTPEPQYIYTSRVRPVSQYFFIALPTLACRNVLQMDDTSQTSLNKPIVKETHSYHDTINGTLHPLSQCPRVPLLTVYWRDWVKGTTLQHPTGRIHLHASPFLT